MTLALLLAPIWLPGAYLVVALAGWIAARMKSRARIARRLEAIQPLQQPRPAWGKQAPRP